MDIIDLLYRVKLEGVVLAESKGNLVLSLSEGKKSLDPVLLKEIKENKNEILKFLKTNNSKKISNSRIIKSEKKEYYQPTSIQNRFYNLQKIDNKSTAYNISSAKEINGEFDYISFSEVLNRIINQNDILRGYFIEHEERTFFKILDEVKFKLECEPINDNEIQNVINEFNQPIDLESWPLYQIKLYRVNDCKYIFMTNFHHSIMDGYSCNLFIEKLVLMYQKVQVSIPNVQYADLLATQAKKTYQDLIEQNSKFWEQKFSGELPVLDIPTDFSRPIIKDTKGNVLYFKIEEDDFILLDEVMKSTGTTLNMILIACYNVLLHKYTGQEDIIIGVVSSGRELSDVKDLMGLLIETTPFRNFPKPNKTLGLFIQEVKDCIINTFDNQPFPFEKILELPSNKKDYSRNPIFDTMLIVQNLDRTKSNVEGIETKGHKSVKKDSKLDIEINVTQINNELYFYVSYRTSLFSQKTIEDFNKRFFNIIKLVALAAKDKNILNKNLGEINIQDKDEKLKILHSFNKKTEQYSDNNYIELFLDSLDKNKDKIALEDKISNLTYGQLDEKSSKIANILASNYSIKQGDFIGVMLSPANEMIITILSILKLGAIYVPISVEYPDIRIKEIADDCSLKLIVVENALEININYPTVLKNELFGNKLKTPQILDLKLTSITSPAYVIYTSGSTGKPKGVLVSHLSLVDYALTFKKYFSLNNKDIVIQQASNAFDTSIEEIFPILLSGGKMIILEYGARDINKIIETIYIKKANILSSVPLVIKELNNYSERVKGLKALISGGDVLKANYINNLISQNIVYDTYGPTETTVCATYKKINSVKDEGCIGAPIKNRKIVILDENNNLCPIGFRGEICIGGIGVAIGYLNRPEMTAEKFVKNSFYENEIFYRTGDSGSWNEDGDIRFLGRKDSQIKLRGIRIELGEIEKCIERHPKIKEATVIVKTKEGEDYLTAYYVSREEIDVSSLMNEFSKSLPMYMVPTQYVWLKKIPLSSNGKINLNALPEPVIKEINEYDPPATEAEEKLLHIWIEVLKIEREKISVNRSFFELGGQSLNAISIIQKVENEFNVTLTIKELFTNITIRTLCLLIESKDYSKKSLISKVEKKEYYPVSHTQRLMYMSQFLHKKSTAYNILRVVEIKGKLDIEKLNDTFRKLIRKHEILHTSFHIIDDNIVQKIEEPQFKSFEYKEVSENMVLSIVKDAIKPFNVNEYPFYRTMLLKIEENRHVLFFDMHHILTDGVSANIVVKDLVNIYEEKEIIPLKFQYKDYSEWQNKLMNSEELINQEKYWLEKFNGDIPVLSMRSDFERPTERNISKANEIHFSIDEKQLKKIKIIVANERSTLYSFLLTIYNILLHKYSGQNDIIIGSPVAGRSSIDLQNNIGAFINMVPMRNELNSDESFHELFKKVTTNALNAFSNQDYPFEELLIKLGIKGETNRNPLFDNVFNFLNYNLERGGNSQLEIIPYNTGFTFSKFDLHFVGLEKNNVISMVLRYSTELFKESTAKIIVDNFIEILNQVVENSEIKIQDIILKQNLTKVTSEKASFESDFNF
ncbi:MAG: amino acid adenylation domain-containing protein [Bacteroidales bacterium]|nr:amino acid adenylation domain-containing protein [Bacteroidales bacterium]